MRLHNIINFMFAVISLTIAGLGFTLSLIVSTLDLWTKRYCSAFFLMSMGAGLSDLIITLSISCLGAEGVTFTKLGIFGESIFQLSIMLMLSLFIFHSCNEDWLRSKIFYFCISLWLVYFITFGIAQFTTFIYYIDSSNVYHRGDLHVLFFPAILLMTVNIAAFYSRRNKIYPGYKKPLWIVLTVIFILLILQLFTHGIRFIILGTTISALIMFFLILKYQAAKVAKQRLNIKILQMRPHFIYNVMTSIYYLCELDRHKAQSVIQSFTVYLQKNFSAIVNKNLIPFEEELEHTQAYLAVEKVRYEKLLFVEYDTPHKSFKLPPLTLQPIVENAVKHGVDAELSPLHIFISTKQLNDGYEITVEDTGPGFDREIIYEKDKNNIKYVKHVNNLNNVKNEAHIGLNNIIERLRTMCGGTLNIEPRAGGGTVVTIRIKDKQR